MFDGQCDIRKWSKWPAFFPYCGQLQVFPTKPRETTGVELGKIAAHSLKLRLSAGAWKARGFAQDWSGDAMSAAQLCQESEVLATE